MSSSLLHPGLSLQRVDCDDPDQMEPNTWTNISATSFAVRIGPNYKENRKKSASLPSLYDCVAIDMYATEKKLPHIARCVDLPTGDLRADELSESYLPASLIINCMVPSYPLENVVWGRNREDGYGYSLVFYYVLSADSRRQLTQRRERIKAGKPPQRYIPPPQSQPNSARSSFGEDDLQRLQQQQQQQQQEDEDFDNEEKDELQDDNSNDDIDISPALRLLHRFMKEPHSSPLSSLRQRLKAITRIVNLDSMNCNTASKKLVQTYNGTPFLIKTTSQFYKTDKYFEIDVDVHRFSYMARLGLAGVRESLKSVVFDFAFVIEGHTDNELPEQILSAARLSKLEMQSATQFPKEQLERMEVENEKE